MTHLDTFRHAGVLFANLEPAPKLLQLQAQVAARMIHRGITLEPRLYHPHITIARLRQPVRPNWKGLTLPPELQQSFAVNEINLYRSQTTPAGAHYEVLSQNRL